MKYILLIVSLLLTTLAFSNNKDKIDPSLLEKYESNSINSVIIVLQEKADISGAEKLGTKLEKANYVIQELQRTANKTQYKVISLLKKANVDYKSFYITNAIQTQIDISLLLKIVKLPEVRIVINDADTPMQIIREERMTASLREGEPEWGITKIKADSVWLLGYKGEGVIVGGQDTGFDYDLDLLIKKYRGYLPDGMDSHEYNWHDAIRVINPFNVDSSLVGIDSLFEELDYKTDSIFMNDMFVKLDTVSIDSIFSRVDSLDRGQINPCGLGTLIPCDDHGHGSHTMGTMVGGDTTDIIGVAPNAKWIACRNMERGWGRPSSYIECFEWFMNPTDLSGQNADASKAPHVINNSWGCPPVEGCNIGNFSIMDEVVNSIKASGVVVVVSAGNSGPACGTISSPAAIFEGSFTVGATRSNDTIAAFSSRGLVTSDSSFRMKPNISAPGVSVRSCLPNNKFGTWSGTSMAGPHVAGVVALMISANPELAGHVDIIEDIIEMTADPKLSEQDCFSASSLEVPNPVYGYGRINAYKAVQLALNTILESTSSADQIADLNITLFPNPTRDIINIDIQKPFFGTVEIDFYTADGTLVLNDKWENRGLRSKAVNVSVLNKGLYLCKLSFANQIITKKFMKM